ncbi:SDR family NAD(P)-dependent oxidoreductase [Streptomyces regalis]|uniref:SDR family NAD(P)-dependent oxidoreductase n=1 Tax=Streptomyces regalis TaxID=68262 RepID=UPI000AD7C1D3|nr:SDR family NAD(P)-dependent oxidoreductase [Streptomyces regalis]
MTGSADGLGRPAADALLSAGHDVVVHARNRERATALDALVERGAHLVVGDFAEREAVRHVAAELNDADPLDAVIHNAWSPPVPPIPAIADAGRLADPCARPATIVTVTIPPIAPASPAPSEPTSGRASAGTDTAAMATTVHSTAAAPPPSERTPSTVRRGAAVARPGRPGCGSWHLDDRLHARRQRPTTRALQRAGVANWAPQKARCSQPIAIAWNPHPGAGRAAGACGRVEALVGGHRSAEPASKLEHKLHTSSLHTGPRWSRLTVLQRFGHEPTSNDLQVRRHKQPGAASPAPDVS